jgi:GTP cyclohydrolase I
VATATRVTAAYVDELLSGYGVDVQKLIEEGSEPALRSDLVILDDIFTATVCPHHLLVARGRALVAYEPGARVLGLGTISRLVDVCSRKMVLQEEIAGDITSALMTLAGARGAFCRIVLDHACLQTRGALQPTARTITFSGEGSLREPSQLESILGRRLSEIESLGGA